MLSFLEAESGLPTASNLTGNSLSELQILTKNFKIFLGGKQLADQIQPPKKKAPENPVKKKLFNRLKCSKDQNIQPP